VVLEDDEVTLSEPWRIEVAEAFDLRLLMGADADWWLLLLDGAVSVRWQGGRLRVDRSVEGLAGADPAPQEVEVEATDGSVDLRAVVDTCSVELFLDDGAVVLTNQVYPQRPVADPLVVAPDGSSAQVRRIELRDLTSAV
jgi:sucrose-6-phosphate hydrolase SacC (GH32 family)